ncbi:MAG: isoprenylcysteine carboxylmethyltransferase family protein, partial [Bacteroidales bacterium]|nr:isoprenylcysteine carboxylmethyltransferase family protein [Bacteroidales bacterium]
VLFLAAVPVVYFTNTSFLSGQARIVISVAAVALSLLGFFIRAIAIGTTPKGTSGRNTKEGQVAESLNTTGIYSMVRHPLYLGNYFMWTGIVLFTFNFAFVVIVTLAFWLYYERIMFAEERFLERKFGQAYMDWANATPAFIPCIRKHKKNVVPFSLKSVLRREYSGVLATVVGFVFIEDLRAYFSAGTFKWETPWHLALIATLLISLILRSLKHHTSVLREEGRS